MSRRGFDPDDALRHLKDGDRQVSVVGDDFWVDYSTVFASSAVDALLQGRELQGPETTALQGITDKGREKNALKLPVASGTRVRFVANLGSVLSYPDIPGENVSGTVVKVRSGGKDATAHDGRVMVQWDDGVFRAIQAEHLRLAKGNTRRASAVRVAANSLDDLSDFAPVMKHGSDDLVHKATKDLWSVSYQGDQVVIERLFDDAGEPLKV